ncbi:MAG TPA: hypothetical protein VGK21_19065, partial [Candidatus Angelobacter sp.]
TILGTPCGLHSWRTRCEPSISQPRWGRYPILPNPITRGNAASTNTPMAYSDRSLFHRYQGVIPHCFTNVKRWSISPVIRDNNPRHPFNQLLEADIVYIKDMIHPDNLSDLRLKKLAALGPETK